MEGMTRCYMPGNQVSTTVRNKVNEVSFYIFIGPNYAQYTSMPNRVLYTVLRNW